MKITITILLIFLILTANLAAFVYVPAYYLKGCPVIVENEIDLYRIYKITTSSSTKSILLPSLQLTTRREILYKQRKIKYTALVNNREFYPPIYLSFETYKKHAVRKTFYKR